MDPIQTLKNLQIRMNDVVNNAAGRGGESVWHGTDLRGAIGIQNEGFRPSKKGWYGPGVYTSHSKHVAGSFDAAEMPLAGKLPGGFRYRTMREDMTTTEFLKKLGIDPTKYPDNKTGWDLFDVKDSAKVRFPNMDGIRIPGTEEQLLIFDEKVANDVFDIPGTERADTVKVQQEKQLAEAQKPKNLTKIIQSVMPRRKDSLLQILGAGEMGHLMAESVGLFVEAANKKK